MKRGFFATKMVAMSVMSRQDVDDTTMAEISKACNVPVEEIQDVYACTPLQIAAITESSMHRGASTFRFILNLSPSLDVDRFCNALQEIVSRTAILRTRIVNCPNGLVQVTIDEIHCTQRPSCSLEEYLQSDKAQPMALGSSLFRTAIIDRKLVLTMHHAIMDHASLTPLFGDIMSIYYGGEPAKRIEYKTFVADCLNVDDSAARTFWASRFKGTPAIFPRIESGYIPEATHKVNRTITLDPKGKELSVVHIPSFIEAAWALTASTYTGSESVAYGMVLSGRSSAASAAAESVLGPTIALFPVQVNLQRDMTVEGILKDRTAARRQVQTHPALQYGLSRIRTVSDAASIASGFQTLLNIRPRWYDPEEAADVSYEDMDEPAAAFALAITFDLQGTTVAISAASDPAVLDERQLNRVLRQFEYYLQSLIIQEPHTKLSRISRINSHDLSEILDWNKQYPATITKCVCIHELFKAQARADPTAIAVDAHDGAATYSELNRLSDRLSQELRRRGVGPESPVVFIFEKSIWTVVTMLAILKAGGVCVPIAATDPPARKRSIISKTNAKIVLTSDAEYPHSVILAPDVFAVSAESISKLPEYTGQVSPEVGASNLAYILFTSGSTGLPKGVMLEHGSLATALTNIIRRCGWNTETRMLQFASYVWDTSIGETFSALLTGGCVCIPSEEARMSALAAYIRSSRINSAWLTPTVLRTLEPKDVPGLRILLSIGEAISPDAASTWGKTTRLFNGWGPCECSILSTIAELTPDYAFPDAIGTPVNGAVWVVNPRNVNELLPIGAVGEIVVDGPGVARGYLNDDVKTGMSFIKPPAWAPSCQDGSGERLLYRTGDLAKYNSDGSLSFVGRSDNQVKIRGQRVELGEVEGVLANCREVQDIFVTTKINEGRTELVAVVCLVDARLPKESVLQEIPPEYSEITIRNLQNVREYAQSRLPSYMVPTVWIAVERMPRTESAKLDRVSISQWLRTKNVSQAKARLDEAKPAALSPPQTEKERILVSVWSFVLAVPEAEIGRESHFIRLGGDSIRAMHAAGKCLERGLQVATTMLLKSMTLAEIADASSMLNPETAKNESLTSALSSHAKKTELEAITNQKPSGGRVSHVNGLKSKVSEEKVTALVPATDSQASMFAVSEASGGYRVNFKLIFRPGLDLDKLRNACKQVVNHHSILRTVFIRRGSSLYQAVLEDFSSNIVIEEQERSTSRKAYRGGTILATFHLINDGKKCTELHLEVHHALYDALSMGMILRDLEAAYTGKPLSEGPEFHSWISHIETLDMSAPKAFWRGLLLGASMPYLVPPVPGAMRGYQLNGRSTVCVSSQNLKLPFGTLSSVVKASWSILLSVALGIRDVVFGEVSANRYLPFPGIHMVKGPCVNLVPVRARLDSNMTLNSLVHQIQELSTAGMPYHHLGVGSIIESCTNWPRWTRFSSAIAFQNHNEIHATWTFGEAEAALLTDGEPGDSTDIYLIAFPGAKNLEIDIRYSPQVFTLKQIQWIRQVFAKILEIYCDNPDKTLAQAGNSLHEAFGPYEIPQLEQPTSGYENGCFRSVSPKSMNLVMQAWKDVGLSIKEQRPDTTIWDCGANIVNCFLLSEYFRDAGYDITTDDIVRNPSWHQLARHIESQSQIKD